MYVCMYVCSVAWAGSASAQGCRCMHGGAIAMALPAAAAAAFGRLLFCCLLVFMFPILVLVPIYERLSVVGTRMRTAHEPTSPRYIRGPQ